MIASKAGWTRKKPRAHYVDVSRPKPILSWLPKSGVQGGDIFSSSRSVKVVHVPNKFWQY
jgi:hypothetical protein